MTTDEKKKVGKKLRAMRNDRGLKQADVAADPRVGISVGTLQAIEGAWYDVRDTSIEKYARFFGTSSTKILKDADPRAVAPTDPLLKDLNEEHLEIARSYMRARKRVRTCIEVLLGHHPAEEQLTALFMKLDALPLERLNQIDALLSAAPEGEHVALLHRIWLRLTTDPNYAQITKAGLDLLDSLPAPKPIVEKKPKSAPNRSA